MLAIGLFCSLIITDRLLCQNINLDFKHIQAKDGLDNRYNNFIKKDSRGFLWISSTNGLYQFDGINLKKHTLNSDVGIQGSNVQSNFIEDSKGNIWFSTYKSVNCYIRDENDFASYQLKTSNGEIISSEYNLFFIEQDSVLWLKAGKQIYRYVPKSGEQNSIGETESIRFAVDTFKDGRLKSIIGCPWINKAGVEFFSLEKTGRQNYFTNGLPPDFNQSIEVSKAIVENDSLVWLFSNAGLLAWRPTDTDSLEIFNAPIASGDFVKDGVVLDSQYLLITTKYSGFWIFDKKKKVFTENYLFKEDKTNSISSNSLREIFIDKQEHLWLSNFDKATIDYSWLYKNQFSNKFTQLKIKAPVVNSIIEAEDSTVWCSTESDGIFRFVQDSIISHHPYLNKNQLDLFHIEPIKKLISDEYGRLWGLSRKSIYLYNGENWKRVFTSSKKLYSFLVLDKTTKIIATNEGLFELVFNPVEKNVTRVKAIDKESSFDIPQLFPSSDSTFFAPSKASSLLLYKKNEGAYNVEEEISLNADIYAILEDKKNKTALLSTSNGLLQLDLNSFEFFNIFEENVILKNAQIYATFKGTKNDIWIVTNQYIWSFNFLTRELLRFGKEDGLLSNEFSLYANLKANDGKIWIGAFNGVLCFNPDLIRPYPYESMIFIKSLLVNREKYPFEKSIDAIHTMDLKYYDNTLEFEVIGVTNYFPKSTRIHYFLEGYNQDWENVDNDSKIQFSKVPPGNYRLKLFSRNINGIESEIREIEIIIQPPFWKTLWFIVVSVFTGIMILLLIFRIILKRRLRQQELIFDALSQERNRIAGEMHDDLGGGLHSIKILINSILRKSESPEAPEKLNKIGKKADELVGNMREIVWALDGTNDNLPDLIAYTRQFFVEFFDTYDIVCYAEILDDIPEVTINGEKRRNIFLCIKESVHNIVKHSKATEVKLLFSLSKTHLTIKVKDNGKGFDDTPVNKFSNGLKNMRKRMEEIEGLYKQEYENGTTITFEIPII
jgi:signal transduction histidine kinase